MAEKTYVCGYKHCQIHEKIPASEAVNVGNRKYHKECSETREKINEIRDLYIDNIDKSVTIPELVGVINRIIFDKKFDVEYMLFAMKNVIRRKLRIKSPYTLYYVADNKQIIKLWEMEIKKKSGDK
jgi:hypothetical protein